MTPPLLHGLARGLLLVAPMFWTVLGALVLGFTLSVVRVLPVRVGERRSACRGLADGRGQADTVVRPTQS